MIVSFGQMSNNIEIEYYEWKRYVSEMVLKRSETMESIIKKGRNKKSRNIIMDRERNKISTIILDENIDKLMYGRNIDLKLVNMNKVLNIIFDSMELTNINNIKLNNQEMFVISVIVNYFKIKDTILMWLCSNENWQNFFSLEFNNIKFELNDFITEILYMMKIIESVTDIDEKYSFSIQLFTYVVKNIHNYPSCVNFVKDYIYKDIQQYLFYLSTYNLSNTSNLSDSFVAVSSKKYDLIFLLTCQKLLYSSHYIDILNTYERRILSDPSSHPNLYIFKYIDDNYKTNSIVFGYSDFFDITQSIFSNPLFCLSDSFNSQSYESPSDVAFS